MKRPNDLQYTTENKISLRKNYWSLTCFFFNVTVCLHKVITISVLENFRGNEAEKGIEFSQVVLNRRTRQQDMVFNFELKAKIEHMFIKYVRYHNEIYPHL